MAQIKSIDFQHVGKQEGCCCDRCGQYIRNIWTIEEASGERYNLGIECFSKLKKSSNLTAFGSKQFDKLLKRIKFYNEAFEAEKALTEETDVAYQVTQKEPASWDTPSCWYGRPWTEYHEWMLNEWYPCRFSEIEKELAKFSKVRF